MTDLLERGEQVYNEVVVEKAAAWLPIHEFEIKHAETTQASSEEPAAEVMPGQMDLLAIGFVATKAVCSRGIVNVIETYVNDATIDRWPS